MNEPIFTHRPESDDSLVVQEVLFSDCYNFVSRDITEGLVIDIGANIGAFTILATKKGLEVEAYEPEPHNFERLKLHAELNKVTPLLVNKGVGSGEMGYFNDNSGGSRRGSSGIGVEIISLNEIVRDREVVFMKMDCEGSEYDIIANATDGTLSHIREFAAEFHPDLTSPEIHSKTLSRLEGIFHIKVTGGVPLGRGGIIYGERKLA